MPTNTNNDNNNIDVTLNLPDTSHSARMSAIKSTLLSKGLPTSVKPKYLYDKEQLTPVIHAALIAGVTSGMTLASACKLSGVTPYTVRSWLRAVDNGGIDPTTSFHAKGIHYTLYRDLLLAEAQNEQRTIAMVQRLAHGEVEVETDVIERETTEPNGNVIKERIAKKSVIPPNFTALSWFAERRHRDWHGKRQVQPGMDAINTDNMSTVSRDGDYTDDVNNNKTPPVIIQVSGVNNNGNNVVNNNIPINSSSPGAQGLPLNVPRDMQFHGAGRISRTPLPLPGLPLPGAINPGSGLADRVIDTNFNMPAMSGNGSDGHLQQDKGYVSTSTNQDNSPPVPDLLSSPLPTPASQQELLQMLLRRRRESAGSSISNIDKDKDKKDK